MGRTLASKELPWNTIQPSFLHNFDKRRVNLTYYKPVGRTLGSTALEHTSTSFLPISNIVAECSSKNYDGEDPHSQNTLQPFFHSVHKRQVTWTLYQL